MLKYYFVSESGLDLVSLLLLRILMASAIRMSAAALIRIMVVDELEWAAVSASVACSSPA